MKGVVPGRALTPNERVHRVWTVLYPALTPGVICGLLCILILTVDQVSELLWMTAEGGWEAWRPKLWLCLTLGLFSIMLWGSARMLLYRTYPPQAAYLNAYAARSANHQFVVTRLRRWAPRLLMAAPTLVVAYILWTGQFSLAAGLVLTLLAVEALVFWRHDHAGKRLVRRGGQRGLEDETIPMPAVWVLVGATLAAFGFAFAIGADRLPNVDAIGSVPLALLALALVLPALTMLAQMALRSATWSLVGTYAVVALVLAAVTFLNLNTGHGLRELAADQPGAVREAAMAEERRLIAGRPPLERHLARWLNERADRARDIDHPLPLVVAAAQGGGLRAAYWTAGALARLQDADPAFACQLFAVTGVSGGSVGALTFQALLDPDRLPCGTTPTAQLATPEGPTISQQARLMLNKDYLAATSAGLFFSDVLQSYYNFGFADRQSMLERTLERRWANKIKRQPGLDRGFLEIVRPDPLDTRKPALFLIATEIGEGRRWIASDVRINRGTVTEAYDLLAGGRIADSWTEPSPAKVALAASGAAGISARFP